MKRRRLRKWAKCACTLAAVLAVGVAVASGFCSAMYLHVSSDRRTARSVTVVGGELWFHEMSHYDWLGLGMQEGWSTWGASPWSWRIGGTSTTPGWRGGIFWDRPNRVVGLAWCAGVNLLYLVGLTLIPAAILWRADRRGRAPGLCGGCGYDRRGLAADAKCPECGTVPTLPTK
jgi:hypothetical protein